MFRRSLVLALCLMLFLASAVFAGGIITDMTEPMYMSYEAQAIKWRDLVGRGEEGFYPAFRGAGVQGGKYVILFRFQPASTQPINYFGRHFTVIFDSRSDLVGMLRIKPEWVGASPVGIKSAEATAVLFIRRYVPSLWRFVKSQMTELRSLEILRDDGSVGSVAAVLSTFYDHKRNTWFFVLVAPDGSVMAFERDLPNAEIDFGEAAGNWLYDAYLYRALNGKAFGQ